MLLCSVHAADTAAAVVGLGELEFLLRSSEFRSGGFVSDCRCVQAVPLNFYNRYSLTSTSNFYFYFVFCMTLYVIHGCNHEGRAQCCHKWRQSRLTLPRAVDVQ